MRIACLHTVQSNIAIFDAAAEAIGLPEGTLHHALRTDLLLSAEEAGRLTDPVRAETATVLHELSLQADGVLLTCSTLGPAVEGFADTGVPVARVDLALARQAVQGGGRLIVLCTLQTALGTTSRLFEQEAASTGCTVEVRLVPDAWSSFRAGDMENYLNTIARAATAAYRDGADRVALAQASMADAAELVTIGPTPMTSPHAGLVAILKKLRTAV